MEELTYLVRIKVDKETYSNFDDIEQVLYDMGANDVDLVEVYED